MSMNNTHSKARMIVAWIFGIYASIVVLFNIPFMQRKTADWVADLLSRQIHSNVEIGSINLGFLNSIIINDVCIEDRNGKEMLKVARLSASINLFKLITNGKIDISTAQLFGAHAYLYRDNPDAEDNFKFIIDAFSSDSDEDSSVNLRINSLIVRHANIDYDILSEQERETLDPNHLKIRNAGFNLSLKQFTPDSLNLSIKRFQATEENSGLDIRELSFKLDGNVKQALLEDFICKLPHSYLAINSLKIYYPDYNRIRSFSFDDTNITAEIKPSDLGFVSKVATNIDDVISLACNVSGIDNKLLFKDISLSNKSNKTNIDLSATISDYKSSTPSIDLSVRNLYLADGEVRHWVSSFVDDAESLMPLYNAGELKYEGNVSVRKGNMESDGTLATDAGNLAYSAKMDDEKMLDIEVESSDIDLKRITNDERFGTISFNAKSSLFLNSTSHLPVGNLNAVVNRFGYNGYEYSNIDINAINNSSNIDINIISEDANANFAFDGNISDIEERNKKVTASMQARNINLHALRLIDNARHEEYSFDLNTKFNFSDKDHINGFLSLQDINISSENGNEKIDNIDINAVLDGSASQSINIKSDIVDANLNGRFIIDELPNDFQNILAYHLPALIEHKASTSSSNIRYDITFYDAPIVHNFIDANYSIESPVSIRGILDSKAHSLSMQCLAPQITYNENTFNNVHINCNSSNGNAMLTVSGSSTNENRNTNGKIIAIAHNDKIDTDIQLTNKAKDNIVANLFATTTFAEKEGRLFTNLKFGESTIEINDSTWTISPSRLTYANNILECDHIRIENGRQYMDIDGRASTNPQDSIVVQLNDMEVAYILDLVSFRSVQFGGMASGKAVVRNLFNNPDANANLFVKNFSLQNGVMGDANILANWDREKNGIALSAHIVDEYMSQIKLTGTSMKFNGVTEVHGYISPEKKELELHVLANNTRADFLNGFLKDVCKNIDGRVNGMVNIVGPFSDVNLIGKPTADLSFTLRATNVPYYISGDTIRLNYHSMDFEDIIIHDKQNNSGVLNGRLTHVKLGNFTYKFDVDMTNLCAYDETEFNSDKFLAQVWANGDIHVNGSDGRPLNIDANVTPCKGSVFAYDSATPDAIVSGSFIDFRDVTKISQDTINAAPAFDTALPQAQGYKYQGDIYMNVNVNLTPNCEIKLRMDNTPDGYISTFGNGTFQAKWYNKGSFQLFGNYNITSGKYRLYLQDLVYRNLDLQDGSKVEFNGNPFDANLHLICKHEINSVPLSDLTTTTAFSSNNKVKVDCYLDITGHLDNMDLSFKFELPNVSEETRQLVRSMINSDEEMNKQMIYLLGFQRFYPNELAQSNIEDYGTQAVNSLISSTISGQINQLLSNMIGSRSKWNFGTGITTGENGWQDLDVEGILSGRLLNDRLLINGNFGYRDNSLTNQANFIGDFEVKYRIWESGDFFVKAYNQTNDRYFTKATLNTQGVGISFQHDFERYTLFKHRKPTIQRADTLTTDSTPSIRQEK